MCVLKMHAILRTGT